MWASGVRAGLRAWPWCQIRLGPRSFEPSAWACAPALVPPGGPGCGATSGLQHPREVWAGGVGPLPRALHAVGTRLWPWLTPPFHSTRLRATCQAFSLGCPAALALGSRGAGEAESRSLWSVSSPGVSPLGASLGTFLADRCGDVVFSWAGPKPRRTRDGHS